MREPFPLQWPAGWPRVTTRIRGPFWASFSQCLGELLDELHRLGAANAVITSNLPLRRDGLPYATDRVDDPGIAVWFVLGGVERVFACDRWDTPSANLRAISLSIAAIRGLERWGAADIVTRVFEGFKSLPGEAPIDWRRVLGVTFYAMNVDHPDHRAGLLSVAKAQYKALMRTAHPDMGGNPERAAEINAAMAAAERELSP